MLASFSVADRDPREDDRVQIESVVAGLRKTRVAGDGNAWGYFFAEDAHSSMWVLFTVKSSRFWLPHYDTN